MKRIALGLAAAGLLAGCAARDVPVLPVEQPVTFEKTSYDEVWAATVAVLKEHFPIYTARKASGDVQTKFEITYGEFEPWRDNAVTRRDHWENTVHTVRRRARADLKRTTTGVQLTVTVEKERRDRAREGARFSFADSGSIFDPAIGARDERLRDPTSDDWQALGRDTQFEYYLLGQIRTRLGVW